MLAINSHMRVFVGVMFIDFRKGLDGIVQLCRTTFNADPFCGAAFVFRNRKGSALKILVYDGQGFWLMQKRLSKGRFHFWPSHPEIAAKELSVLLFNGSAAGACFQDEWRRLT